MKNKKTLILSVIASLALLALILGATYAYFQTSGTTGTNTDVKVTTHTTDVFNFEVGNDISIYADATTFASGKGNATGNTFAKAILTANNKTNTSTMNYYLYLNISKNLFNYTQNEETPELLLTITDANGNSITDITSLTYKTVTDGKGAIISGYDITNKNGVITLFDNKSITANPAKTDKWNITITLVNYNVDQTNNMGKNFNAKLMIQKNEYKPLTNYIISQYTGTQGENNIYYHDGTLENGINDNSYRFAGGNYKLSKKAIDNEYDALIKNNDDVKGLINYYCSGSIDYTVECTSWDIYFTLSYDETHTQYSTYKKVLNKAVYDGYLESDNIKNYVCFGSNEENCPYDNLYRIIGVFDGKVKLISNDYKDAGYANYSEPAWDSWYLGEKERIEGYKWSGEGHSGTNTWSESTLNNSLNTTFLGNLGEEWSSKIATKTWKVGGNTAASILNVAPAQAYVNEILNPVTNNTSDGKSTYDAKIGLMYVTDYEFASVPSNWAKRPNLMTDTIDYGKATLSNWLYMGQSDLTITRISDDKLKIFGIVVNVLYEDTAKKVSVDEDRKNGIRPTFYLNEDVSYVSGSGTQSDPIRIS